MQDGSWPEPLPRSRALTDIIHDMSQYDSDLSWIAG